MKQKLFLESNKSVLSNNVERSINLDLSTKTRLLPNDNIVDKFSLFEQYNKERDECTKYRLILNVNPVCSNILFNARTEIVLNEGTSACTLLIGDTKLDKEEVAPNAVNTTKEIDYMLALRNTEYSHKDNGCFVYHCGYDIFNNHMLRKKGFIHVNRLGSSEDDGTNYNTISDYNRDGRGEIVEQEIGVKIGSEKVKMHLYQYDTIMSMPLAFMDNCIEKDGWWGFTNPNTIELPNNSGNSISINCMMANNKSCEFIDLYPDRSLFSFTPKFNKYRRRIEKNWDYCITYPYKSDYKIIDKICGGERQAIRANIKYGFNTAGQPIVYCSSYFKHNLKSGDYVTFYYYMPHYSEIRSNALSSNLRYCKIDNEEYLFKENDFDINGVLKDGLTKKDFIKKIGSKEFAKYSIKIKVESIGDANGLNPERVFTVKYRNITNIYEYMKYFGCFYKKNVSNTDCLYYSRKFKKIKNNNGEDLRSDVNKVAFGCNIYGDEIAQVLFLDDIDINNILDNNNRPLSEVYFTIIKRNAGRNEWYNKKDYSNNAIEVSHCFGELTSGIDFSGIDDEPFEYNIHYMHNMNSAITETDSSAAVTFSAWGETILSGMPQTLEKDITIGMDEFYGDIVEYDISKAKETVIGNVFYRFNTAQREFWGRDYKHIKQDSIVSDDYDFVNGEKVPFTVDTYFINNVQNSIDINGNSNNIMYGNIYPEGYFYNPHNKISVRENDDIEMSSPAKHINYTDISLKIHKKYLLLKENGTIKVFNKLYTAEKEKGENDKIVLQNYYYEINFTSPVNYNFYKGDNIAFFNRKTNGVVWGSISGVSGNNLTLIVDGAELDEFDIIDADGAINISLFTPYSNNREFYAYWSTNNIPIYAKLCEGAKKFVWRKIVNPSKMTRDDELFETTFSNGRFYLEKNINLFVKRQDPNGKYGLSFPMFKTYQQTKTNPMVKYIIQGREPIDMTDVVDTLNNLTNNCY
jgi:hypothetical protein